MKLAEALRYLPHPSNETPPLCPCLALVGAGGKTSTLFRLGRELLRHYPSVVLTTTTHLGYEQAGWADWQIVANSPADLPEDLPPGLGLVCGPERPQSDGGMRWIGLDDAALAALRALTLARPAPLLIEADGARRLPLKAPALHEPVIPDFVETVVVAAGLSGLGRPIQAGQVHRPELFAACSGLAAGQPVTAAALTNVLLHPQGGLQGIPAGARRVALLNQADTVELQAQAQTMAVRLLGGYDVALIACFGAEELDAQTLRGAGPVLAVYEPIGAVVLAAGAARRMGQPKQLLDWQGQPLVRRAAATALAAGLQPVIVVVGAEAETVAAAVSDLPVQVVLNPAWAEGQSTSLQAGLAAAPANCGALIFLLADQPFVPEILLSQLRALHAASLPALAAPWCAERRANPALFDRRTFSALHRLQGDTGGRALFGQSRRYPVTWLPWLDERLLLDVDTLEDYQRLQGTTEL